MDKFKGTEDRRSIFDILSLDTEKDWDIISEKYKAKEIEKVIIDKDIFTNYGNFQFIWEKSYKESPTRSATGAIPNINSMATFVTPHLLINFSLMSIDDYRALMRKDLSKNEFVVECYDPIYNERVSCKMYFAPAEMAKLYTIAKIRYDSEKWEEFIEIVGVQDYTVEMIGTNNSLDLVSITYHLNPPSGTGVSNATYGEKDIYKGEDVIIGESASSITNETFNGKYKFSQWSTDRSQSGKNNYINGNVYTINSDLVLYAQWDSVNTHTLSFSYGVADPSISGMEWQPESSRLVNYQKSIGNLPTFVTPTVTYDGKEFTDVYTNGAFYKTPVKVANSVSVSNNELYWVDRDSTLYLLFDVKKSSVHYYRVQYFMADKPATLFATAENIEYGTKVALASYPISDALSKKYEAVGWFIDKECTKEFDGIMPPYILNLYQKWVEK